MWHRDQHGNYVQNQPIEKKQTNKNKKQNTNKNKHKNKKQNKTKNKKNKKKERNLGGISRPEASHWPWAF